jgi:serine-type D-Ala-D-Ala carboxypeptidase (penicillin-binding protein 5/6)
MGVLLTVPTSVTSAQEGRSPAPGARAAIVVDADTGAVLYERNSRAELAPASLTKMVTALVALERAPLDRPVHIAHPYVVTPILIGLEPGDTLPLEAVLHGLLLNSGNDAALAIAEVIGDGSTERFVGWMNDLSRRLGLQRTQFKNPHGLDQDGHVSSAYDMAIIGRALMRQPALAAMVGRPRHEVVGPPRWVFQNRNPLLGQYPGVDGIKTGFDDNAGLCLVATAIRGDRRVVAVVMNSAGYGADAASLLDYAFEDTRWGRLNLSDKVARPVLPRLAMLRADLGIPGPGTPPNLARAIQMTRSAGDPGLIR